MGTWGLDPSPRFGLVRQECGSGMGCRVCLWIVVGEAGGGRLVQGTWELADCQVSICSGFFIETHEYIYHYWPSSSGHRLSLYTDL